MTTENGNPTGSDSGATTADPIDRIEAFLAAQDGDDGTQDDNPPAQNAAKTPDKPEGGEQGKDQEPQFTTSHLSQYLGLDESAIDVDADGQPVFKTKIDGKESPVKFADLLKSYQLNAHAENRVREAADREKAADRKLQEADQAIQAKYQEQQESLKTVHAMSAIAQEELKGEYNAVNWDALWQQDPAQARALERRFEQRQSRINGVFQQLNQRDAQAKRQAVALRQANEEKSKAAQVRRLMELIPEWKDGATAEKERQDILSWVEKSGFEPSDLDLNKASQVYLLRKTWQHDTLQKARPEIENRVRTAPKLVKPGQAQSTDGNAATVKSLKQQVRQTGGNATKSLADYLVAAGKA